MGIPVGIRSNSAQPERFHPPQPLHQKPNRIRLAIDSDDESEPDNSADSSDGLPPDSYNRSLMPRVVNNMHAIRRNLMSKKNDGSGNSMKELTQAILKIWSGVSNPRLQNCVLQQLVEMEKQRMKIAKELELQRMQCFMKTRVELSQLKNRLSETNNSHQHGHGIIDNNDNAENNKNNNNSGSSD